MHRRAFCTKTPEPAQKGHANPDLAQSRSTDITSGMATSDDQHRSRDPCGLPACASALARPTCTANGRGCVKTCTSEQRADCFLYCLSRDSPGQCFSFQTEEIKKDFLCANREPEFSHGLGQSDIWYPGGCGWRRTHSGRSGFPLRTGLHGPRGRGKTG